MRKSLGRITFDSTAPDTERQREADRRALGEQTARGYSDGRKERRRNRSVQIALKTTDEKRQQFGRLRQLTELSYTEIFEYALDAFEREWKARNG